MFIVVFCMSWFIFSCIAIGVTKREMDKNQFLFEEYCGILLGLVAFMPLITPWVISDLRRIRPRNYLFICAQNQVRSPCAAQCFQRLLEERGIQAEVESAGLLANGYRMVDDEMLAQADSIFIMDDNCLDMLLRKFPQMKERLDKIINLEILDCYDKHTYKFSDEYFEKIVIRKIQHRFKNDPQKAAEIELQYRNRPEIKEKWSLEKVLESRHLEQYI